MALSSTHPDRQRRRGRHCGGRADACGWALGAYGNAPEVSGVRGGNGRGSVSAVEVRLVGRHAAICALVRLQAVDDPVQPRSPPHPLSLRVSARCVPFSAPFPVPFSPALSVPFSLPVSLPFCLAFSLPVCLAFCLPVSLPFSVALPSPSPSLSPSGPPSCLPPPPLPLQKALPDHAERFL